ncbi:MAG: hypothetical protein KZQ82_20350, partial [Candidatus Thiodiazotropha sp. (ex Lucinoma annulata)]|nr:hypothetical protein [Candidatus Thiodiazotropha sp. (ex Lucinoma annulata)]
MAGWFVTTNDIRQWTETEKRRSEEILPLLVKKLILASCEPIYINFPSGDDIAIDGWDGILEVAKGNEFVPGGISGWEFGTSDNVKGKADEDYDKRTDDPRALSLEDTTYVFATSRLWSKKKTWCASKNTDEKWKDVQGINAESLSNWLEQCPAVHRWFASIIGKRTADLWDLEEAWKAYSCSTEVNLNGDFLINDRINECEELHNNLQGKAAITRIKAISQSESYGFVLANLVLCYTFQSKTIIVKKQSAWDWLICFERSLILIPDDFVPSNIGYAVDKGHHIILPIDTRNAAKADITLAKMSRQARIQSIQAIGFNEEQALTIYQETRGFFGPLVRHYLLKPIDIIKPDWVESTDPLILFSLMFITEWDSDNEADQVAISALIGKEYDEIEVEIIKLSQTADPPVRLVGNKRQVVSKFDLWLHIAHKISKAIIERLDSIIIDVIGDEDPSYDLDPDERFMANIRGATPRYSNYIKKGMADTLALLSAYGDEFSDQVGETLPSDSVAGWVYKLFEKNVDGKIWYSLNGNVPLIAEAAPKETLDAVERATSGEHPPIAGLFSEGEGTFSGCPHSNLLWALECLAWNVDYLPRVTTCLARLTEIDPGGRYSNRTFNSL